MAATDNKTVQQVWERSPNPYIGDSQEFYCGIEYEIEGIYAYHGSSTYAQMVEDSSLRNNGREFITVPGTLLNQLDWFDKIHSKIEYIIGDKPDTTAYPPHSERTSTHVHVNVLNLTMSKLAQFVRLYILFEPYFFSKVEPSRKDNIYCAIQRCLRFTIRQSRIKYLSGTSTQRLTFYLLLSKGLLSSVTCKVLMRSQR
jgi:hypothetical protein